MIDLTPLDVRKKRGDFGRGVRGYNPQEVDGFLELVAERLEELVKENMTLRERAERLAEQVSAQTGREQAVQQALVTAQQLREEIQMNAQKEAELVVQEARARGREVLAAAERQAIERTEGLQEIERRRLRFLAQYRQFIERELDHIAAEEGKAPLGEIPAIDLDLGEERTFRYDTPPLPGVKTLSDEEADVFPSLGEGRSGRPEGGSGGDRGGEDPDSGWERGPSHGASASSDPHGSGSPSVDGPAGAQAPPDPIAADDPGDGEADAEAEGIDPSAPRWMPNFPRQSSPGDD